MFEPAKSFLFGLGGGPERGEPHGIGKGLVPKHHAPIVVGPHLGSFKKGGEVKETGLYTLHKGETVSRAKKAGETLGGSGKHKSGKKHHKKGKSITVRKATSGGYVAEPTYETSPGEMAGEPETHVHPDMESVHQHLDEHFGEPESEGAAGAAEEGAGEQKETTGEAAA